MAETSFLRVRLTPRGGRSAITRYEAETLHARVSAPPVDGAANKALIELLSDSLKIPKSRIAFSAGEASREKTLCIEGIGAEELQKRIETALKVKRGEKG